MPAEALLLELSTPSGLRPERFRPSTAGTRDDMSALTTVAAAFILAILVATLMWGGAGLVIALPVALVVLGAVFALDVKRRRGSVGSMEAERERARSDKVDFTERDKQTLYARVLTARQWHKEIPWAQVGGHRLG
jgi:Flp pilus assembly protein TadB